MDSKIFRDRLVLALKNKGWSRRDGAEAIGISVRALQRWCHDEASPHPSKLAKAAGALGVSVAWLTGEEDSRNEGLDAQNVLALLNSFREEMRREIRELADRPSAEPALSPPGETTIHPAQTGRAQYMVEHLMAGLGSEVTQAEDQLWAPEFAQDNIVLARVQGTSMEPTIAAGKTIVLRVYQPPIVLPPAQDGRETPYASFRAEVPADAICVLSVNDGGPTLKRIRYHQPPPGSPAAWWLQLWADNPDYTGFGGGKGYRSEYVKASDKVTVHARVVAIGRWWEDEKE